MRRPSLSCIILRLERVGPLILSGKKKDAMATQTFGVWISRPSQAIEGRDADTLFGFYAAAEVLKVNPPT